MIEPTARRLLTHGCYECPELVRSRSQIVCGAHAELGRDFGPHNVQIVFIGEAPGYGEDKAGVPFYKRALTGAEVRNLLLKLGLNPVTYITNMLKCHPKDDRDPTPEEISACSRHLEAELAFLSPDVVVTAGRFSTRYLLGREDVTMDMVSGIPYRVPGRPFIILPMTHPAAGFRRQQDMTAVMNAFNLLKDWRNLRPRSLPILNSQKPHDYRVSQPQELQDYLARGSDVISIDTEDGPGDTTLCATISNKPGTSRMIRGDDPATCAVFESYITNVNPVCVIHSALHDLPSLRKINITPTRIFCTMTAAYMLQDEPLGLKPLAWRHNNTKMDAYLDVTEPARIANALQYLIEAAERKWPDPEPVIVWEKGSPKIKKPQNIGKKIKRIVDDVIKGKLLKDGTPVHPRKRWLNIDVDEGRGIVEAAMGEMPDGFLCDIPLKDAVEYACSDADNTLQLYPHFLNRLRFEGLWDAFMDEMACLWFIDDMQEFGIPCDAERFESVSVLLQVEMARVEQEIYEACGHQVQLSSALQVSHLLYDKDKLDLGGYLPRKMSKKTGKTRTSDEVLAQIEDKHPVVALIREHRELKKLDDSYARKIPRIIKPDGRAYPKFRTTNTNTGRLSEEIWMTIPKQSKYAKDMRNGARALEGCAWLSMDYSQIELRLTAHEANDASMIEAFKRGIDLHALTAYEMFFGPLDFVNMPTDAINTELAKVDKDTQRRPAKTINFGIIYGITAEGLYRNMIMIPGCGHWTVDLAQKYINRYFEIRPGIVAYIDDTEAMAKRHGKIWDWAGRIRRIPGATLVNEYYRAEALRQACNGRIQVGAQSIIKRAMGELEPVYQDFRKAGYVCSPMIQVHDSVESMVSMDLLPIIVPMQKAIMEQAKELKTGVRVDVQVSYGGWGELKDYEM